MADPPLALTYVASALNLPPWLSYTSSPTATILAAYTIATLAPNGAPTLITGAVEITRYETVLLQLAITVDSAADVRGQDLGNLYTTAGGTGTETVVNEYGGTRRFTLGAGETSTGAAPTSASATAAPSRTRASPSPPAPSASQEATAPSTCTSSSLLGGLLREDRRADARPPTPFCSSSVVYRSVCILADFLISSGRFDGHADERSCALDVPAERCVPLLLCRIVRR